MAECRIQVWRSLGRNRKIRPEPRQSLLSPIRPILGYTLGYTKPAIGKPRSAASNHRKIGRPNDIIPCATGSAALRMVGAKCVRSAPRIAQVRRRLEQPAPFKEGNQRQRVVLQPCPALPHTLEASLGAAGAIATEPRELRKEVTRPLQWRASRPCPCQLRVLSNTFGSNCAAAMPPSSSAGRCPPTSRAHLAAPQRPAKILRQVTL